MAVIIFHFESLYSAYFIYLFIYLFIYFSLQIYQGLTDLPIIRFGSKSLRSSQMVFYTGSPIWLLYFLWFEGRGANGSALQ